MAALPSTNGRFRLLPGGDVLPSDPAILRDYHDMAAAAEAALARRTEAYPAMVARSAMTDQDAASDIAAWTALAAEWRWIDSGTGAAPCRTTLFARIDALDLALERTATAAMRNPRDEALRHQQDIYTAMRWHLSRLDCGVPEVHHRAALTHELRAAFAVCPTCDRSNGDPARVACIRTDCAMPWRKPVTTPAPQNPNQKDAA